MKVLMVSPSYGLNIGGAEIQLNKLEIRISLNPYDFSK